MQPRINRSRVRSACDSPGQSGCHGHPIAVVESAQARWRAVTGASLVALVRSGAQVKNGVPVEREEAAAV